jgi:hypothetical protein
LAVSRRPRGDLQTRFKSAYDDDELRDVIVDVARSAQPAQPLKVSTRRWDAAREQAGHPDAPSARQITTRLNPAGRHVLSWPRIVELALAGERAWRHAVGRAAGRPEEWHLGLVHLVALRRVALHLGRQSFAPDAYTSAVEAILASVDPSERARLAQQFPTEGQIERIARNARGNQLGRTAPWDAALELAGLGTRDSTTRVSQRRAALAYHETIDLYVQLTGRVPTLKQARRFAEHNKIAIRVPQGAGAHEAWIDEVAAYVRQRAVNGFPEPEAPARRTAPPTIPPDIKATLPPRVARGRWEDDPDAMFPAVAEYLSALEGRAPDLRDYRQTKKRLQAAHWPSPHAMGDHHGGFTNTIRKTRRWMQSQTCTDVD